MHVEARDSLGQWRKIDIPFSDERNYRFFSVLGGVRNSHNINPIHPLRGFPPVSSAEVAGIYLNDRGGIHSTSWATVQELMDYDWTQVATLTGHVGEKEFILYKLEGRPDQWSSSIGGGSIRHITEKEMEEAVGEISWKKYHETENTFAGKYCKIEWEVKYFEFCSQFLSEVMPQLWKLGPPQDVRIVYWFNN